MKNIREQTHSRVLACMRQNYMDSKLLLTKKKLLRGLLIREMSILDKTKSTSLPQEIACFLD